MHKLIPGLLQGQITDIYTELSKKGHYNRKEDGGLGSVFQERTRHDLVKSALEIDDVLHTVNLINFENLQRLTRAFIEDDKKLKVKGIDPNLNKYAICLALTYHFYKNEPVRIPDPALVALNGLHFLYSKKPFLNIQDENGTPVLTIIEQTITNYKERVKLRDVNTNSLANPSEEKHVVPTQNPVENVPVGSAPEEKTDIKMTTEETRPTSAEGPDSDYQAQAKELISECYQLTRSPTEINLITSEPPQTLSPRSLNTLKDSKHDSGELSPPSLSALNTSEDSKSAIDETTPPSPLIAKTTSTASIMKMAALSTSPVHEEEKHETPAPTSQPISEDHLAIKTLLLGMKLETGDIAHEDIPLKKAKQRYFNDRVTTTLTLAQLEYLAEYMNLVQRDKTFVLRNGKEVRDPHFDVIREERSWWRQQKLGNTKTWSEMVSTVREALWKKITETRTPGQKIKISQAEYQKLLAIFEPHASREGSLSQWRKPNHYRQFIKLFVPEIKAETAPAAEASPHRPK